MGADFVIVALACCVGFLSGETIAKTPQPGRSQESLKLIPPEDRGYLAFPVRIMNRSTYEAYTFDAEADESATISYSVSKTGWVRIRLVSRVDKYIVWRTLQQWTESHYDNKKRHQVQWDGKDASGNRIDPRRMFILFEARDSREAGLHETHFESDCIDPELTVSMHKHDDRLTLVATLPNKPSREESASDLEGRVYLDGELIDRQRFSGATTTFTFDLVPRLFSGSDHMITVNLDDRNDHIAVARIRVDGAVYNAMVIP